MQAAVLKDGVTVVDACSGEADPETQLPVTRDTPLFGGSTAKGVLSSLAHVLVAAGALGYDRPIAELWPQFAAHGKGGITVRHVLLHQAGLPGLPGDLATEQLCDWEHTCVVMADAEPWWEPGTRFGYHARTFGFLLGETLQRATGRPLAALLRKALNTADDVFLGVPAGQLSRVARQLPASEPLPSPGAGSALARAMPPGATPSAAFANRPDVLRAAIPSMGTMSALGAARVYAARPASSAPGPAESATVMFTGRDEVMDRDGIG